MEKKNPDLTEVFTDTRSDRKSWYKNKKTGLLIHTSTLLACLLSSQASWSTLVTACGTAWSVSACCRVLPTAAASPKTREGAAAAAAAALWEKNRSVSSVQKRPVGVKDWPASSWDSAGQHMGWSASACLISVYKLSQDDLSEPHIRSVRT